MEACAKYFMKKISLNLTRWQKGGSTIFFRRKLNFRSLIQSSETLQVEIIEIRKWLYLNNNINF